MRCWRRWRGSPRRSWRRRSTVSFRHRQGAPPQASYLFKHALVQDAAYGTLLREPRRALHARIAESFESQFAETESRPETLAHHCTEAGLIEKAAGLWGNAGQRSLALSALVEAAAQLTRALEQIATLPGTRALRREKIKLQVALITPLIHVKGYAADETKAAAEQARLLIDDRLICLKTVVSSTVLGFLTQRSEDSDMSQPKFEVPAEVRNMAEKAIEQAKRRSACF